MPKTQEKVICENVEKCAELLRKNNEEYPSAPNCPTCGHDKPHVANDTCIILCAVKDYADSKCVPVQKG